MLEKEKDNSPSKKETVAENSLDSGSVSGWWYILSIFFGVIGGIIAWSATKDRDPQKATRFFVIGFIFFIFYSLGILLLIVFLSFGIKKSAQDARIISDIIQIRAASEMIYFDEGNSYNFVSCEHPDIFPFCRDIEKRCGEKPTIYSSKNSYCIYVKLPSGYYYCVDDKQIAGKTLIYPEKAGYCDGRTFICPR